ncbi:hypothetical protein Pint_26090 [Pistacia integerrima]|nr:hypothetical protein Pint_26090 [Pistacia integerrima]
MCIHLV